MDSYYTENNEKTLSPVFYKHKIEVKNIKSNSASVTAFYHKKLYFKDEKEEGIFSSIINIFD